MKDLLFDKKFVITAAIIAFIYCGLVIFINKILGKEAAGVAGVSLTALATVIFKQFESLRFKKIDNPIDIKYRFSWWQVALLAVFFAGFNSYLQDIKDYFIPFIGKSMKFDSNTNPGWLDTGIVGTTGHMVIIKDYSVWEKAVECFAFFIGAIIAAKCWYKISYGVVIVAALIGIVLDFFREELAPYLFYHTSLDNLVDELEDYEYSLLYILFVFIGMYLFSNKSQKISTTVV